MLLDYLILLTVRPNEAREWFGKIIDYINEHQEDAIEELKQLCDINNYTSPHKSHEIVHNAKLIYDDVMAQINE